MEYRALKNGYESSLLGYGCMRLPLLEDGKTVNETETRKLLLKAYNNGVRYFDTAWPYHNGMSEVVLCDSLRRFPRESYFLADKYPGHQFADTYNPSEIFEAQLKKCGVEYFDFYLLHSIEEGYNGDTYERLDCYNWALQKKAEGLIKHFGFSFHGSPEYLVTILDKHPEVEFVQIQLNYADWNNPIIRSRELYEILHERNIPIIVMEPVRGGFLADPIESIRKIFDEVLDGKSYASLALRYAASLDGVMTVLSGMSTEEQVSDNVAIFSDLTKVNEKESKAIDEAVKILNDVDVIGCTKCKYCNAGCPMNIPIHDVFSAVNDMSIYREEFRPRMFYIGATTGKGKAKDCIKCGQCEAVCPQHLNIIELLEKASEKLDD